ncbi:MAG: hypothetical protein LBV42_06075 [Methanobrevibacter sp.]|jgi:hypothetical protein|nr:hypothetical protein [Methanobrevibacter sp.]
MIKKILSILLIALLIMSSTGCVSAKSYDYDCDIELADTFTIEEFHSRFDHSDWTHGYHWGWKEAQNVLESSGFFTLVKWDTTGYEKSIFRASKLGDFNYTLDNAWLDDDYYHFHIKPHKTKFEMVGADPYMSNDILRGAVHWALDEHANIPKALDYYYFATCKILVQDMTCGGANLYTINRTAINTCDPYFAHIPLEMNRTYQVWYMLFPNIEGMADTSFMKIVRT